MTPSVPLLREFDPHLCRMASHWATRRSVHRFFGIVSRLGDGVFWYGLMVVLAACGGMHGLAAALQMLGTGLFAWLLYRTLKLHTRRPRPFRAHTDVTRSEERRVGKECRSRWAADPQTKTSAG